MGKASMKGSVSQMIRGTSFLQVEHVELQASSMSVSMGIWYLGGEGCETNERTLALETRQSRCETGSRTVGYNMFHMMPSRRSTTPESGPQCRLA